LVIVMVDDADGDRKRRAAEAVGDPVLDITLFTHNERNPTCE